jgi:hypothetical protein
VSPSDRPGALDGLEYFYLAVISIKRFWPRAAIIPPKIYPEKSVRSPCVNFVHIQIEPSLI